MTDGAHAYIGAESAMKAIVGGETPEEQEPHDFEIAIRTAALGPVSDLDYDGGARAVARLVLNAYEDYPQLTELSDDHLYLRDLAGEIDWSNPIALNVTLYEVVKKLHPDHSELFSGLTGFMWGWAVNAARRILDLGPLPNPALMTIQVSDTAGGATIDELLDQTDQIIEGDQS